MSTGTLKYTGTTNGYFTNNQTYTILTITSPGEGDSANYVVLADTGKLYSVNSNNTSFTLVELYALTKVV